MMTTTIRHRHRVRFLIHTPDCGGLGDWSEGADDCDDGPVVGA